jgi:hypothetical protein
MDNFNVLIQTGPSGYKNGGDDMKEQILAFITDADLSYYFDTRTLTRLISKCHNLTQELWQYETYNI